ncbi:hypothetical protein BTVI_113901 [Pitangus sulphuratus]|nr:hypothetical protein BTVI_113901 [Pitangus sulphuratus]
MASGRTEEPPPARFKEFAPQMMDTYFASRGGTTYGPLTGVCHICKQSWESREVPTDWKLANIVLIFKMGKKKDPGNYRPASLTSVLGKVMEKIILEDIEKHLKDNAVTSHSQHSFLRGKSCLSNLVFLYDKVTHLADQGKPVNVIFWDFSKAFDPVFHRILDKMSITQLENTSCGGATVVTGSIDYIVILPYDNGPVLSIILLFYHMTMDLLLSPSAAIQIMMNFCECGTAWTFGPRSPWTEHAKLPLMTASQKGV